MSVSTYSLWDRKVVAIQLLTDDVDDFTKSNAVEVAEFCKGEAVIRYDGVDKSYGVEVVFAGPGGERQHAFFSDYVVQNIGGKLDVMDADEFESTYRQNNSNSTITDIAVECFTDGNVISYQGENYYRGCGVVVTGDLEVGPASTCVKRVNHPGNIHEDYDGKERSI